MSSKNHSAKLLRSACECTFANIVADIKKSVPSFTAAVRCPKSKRAVTASRVPFFSLRIAAGAKRGSDAALRRRGGPGIKAQLLAAPRQRSGSCTERLKQRRVQSGHPGRTSCRTPCSCPHSVPHSARRAQRSGMEKKRTTSTPRAAFTCWMRSQSAREPAGAEVCKRFTTMHFVCCIDIPFFVPLNDGCQRHSTWFRRIKQLQVPAYACLSLILLAGMSVPRDPLNTALLLGKSSGIFSNLWFRTGSTLNPWYMRGFPNASLE